jgi:hypothetical protein
MHTCSSANLFNSASSITRDVSRVIRDNIAARQGALDHTPAPQTQPLHPQALSHPSEALNALPTNPSPLHLCINILQHGKRIAPPYNIPASQCPDLTNARQLLSRRFAGELPGLPADPDPDTTWSVTVGWRFKVWLPEGLILIEHDSDWTLTLLAAEKVDWMDSELKVLVETEET